MERVKMLNQLDNIMNYENGTLDRNGFYNLFSDLIKSGSVWQLQGNYGRTAKALIESGQISQDGVVHWGIIQDLEG